MKVTRTDLAALAIVTVWGVNFALLKLALGEFDPLAFNWLRYLGMLALAWSVAGPAALELPRRDRGRVLAAGLAGYGGYIPLSIVGLSFTTAFSNALLIAAAPLFSVLFLVAWRAEAVSRAQALGVAISLGGVLVFLSGKAGHLAAGLGDAISLAAAALYALYTVLQKPLLARHPARFVTAWTLTAGGLPILVATAPVLLAQPWSRVTWLGWLVLAWSVVVPVYVAWTVWAWASARAGVARTNAYMYLVPLVGAAASLVLTGESFGPAKILGALVVLAGLVLVRRAPVVRPEALPLPAVAGASR